MTCLSFTNMEYYASQDGLCNEEIYRADGIQGSREWQWQGTIPDVRAKNLMHSAQED